MMGFVEEGGKDYEQTSLVGGWRDVVKIESFSRPKREEGQLGRSLTYRALAHIRLALKATITSHSRLSFNKHAEALSFTFLAVCFPFSNLSLSYNSAHETQLLALATASFHAQSHIIFLHIQPPGCTGQRPMAPT